MGGVNVKNTMVERVLHIIAPHPCSGCGKVGVVLCEDCKNDIISEPFLGCILCGVPQRDGICPSHTSSITRSFTVSERIGALEQLINRYKFEHVKAAALPLAQLLDETLPLFPEVIELIPIPTVRSHIRERGYDQVELLARFISSMRDIPIRRVLMRRTNKTQHTVGRDERLMQASDAFCLKSPSFLHGKTVLLLDDVVTTGATLESAAKLLKAAGATVWTATLARQPLD